MSSPSKPLTKKDLRKFGLTVGGILALLAGVSWWRGHELPPIILGALAVLLIVPGLVAPTLLRPVEKAWMRFAAGLAWVNTRIILTVLFYVIFFPIGVVRRALGKDGLNRKLGEGESSDWVKREGRPVDPARYRMQF
jgi:Saxitoxin biosynthesis operon protein SxtJ